MLRHDEDALTVQHVTGYSDHVKLKVLRLQGAIFLQAIKGGSVTRRELIENAELECLHDGEGWYLPLVMRALRILDGCVEEEADSLPPFLVGYPHG